MVRIWEEAKHQVAVPEGFADTLIVGGQYSLRSRLLIRWVQSFQETMPNVALRCEVGMPRRLIREMVEGVLDIAVLYRPEQRPGLIVEELFSDRLILVSTDPTMPLSQNYVFVDWGERFRDEHAIAFPDLHNPGLTLDLGAIGVHLIINRGGAGYFPERIVKPHIESGRLRLVDDAPSFQYPAYLVYQENFSTQKIMNEALATLRKVSAQAAAGDLPPPFWA